MFICDTCNEKIVEASDGLLYWNDGAQWVRIVHRICSPKAPDNVFPFAISFEALFAAAGVVQSALLDSTARSAEEQEAWKCFEKWQKEPWFRHGFSKSRWKTFGFEPKEGVRGTHTQSGDYTWDAYMPPQVRKISAVIDCGTFEKEEI